MEQLHAHDCHGDVTETSGHRVRHKKYKNMHNTGTVSQAIIAQWCSPAGTSHTVYMDVLHTSSTSCSARDMGLHQDGMNRKANVSAATPLRLVQARP